MRTFSAEQVRTLAPDASAARAGEALGDQRRWSGTGRTDSAAWGLCQGSGSTPYHVAVDLSGPAYRCSCPSRKIPCKHSLGLLFLTAEDHVPNAAPPDWVREWLEGRTARATAAAARADRPAEIDPAARAKRIEARERKVVAGIDELDRWLRDLIRRGLDGARGEGYRFWDAMGARLVDAQAGGLGRSVRGLGSAAHAGEAWPHLLLEGAARLHLLTEAYRRADTLPAGLRSDVRSLVGWTIKEDELPADDEVEDRWLVVGRRVDDRGDIITARTFLLGQHSGRFALVLAFGVGAAPPTVLALPGQALRARLAFYPSATPLRAAVRPTLEPDGDVSAIPHRVTVEQVVENHAERLARNPFLDAWPVAVEAVVPVIRDGRLLIRDAEGSALPVAPETVGPWLLAVSGGHPITLVGEWDGRTLRPLGALAEGRLADIGGFEREPSMRPETDPDWSALLSAALLGTERTGGTVPIPNAIPGSGDGRDAESALLSAAAALAVRRRAGRRTLLDAAPLGPAAEPDPRPVLAGPPARLLGLTLTEEPGLVPEVLDLVTGSGRRPPDEWLPELLELGARNTAVADRLAEIGGPRARWLAAVVPELAAPIVTDLDDLDEAWEAARGATARAAVVRSLRRRDPAGGRERLANWWPNLAADERSHALDALGEGLGVDDEPFLVGALEDRRADVRRIAAGLLARLPQSAFAQDLEARARPLLASHGRLRPSLAVTLPVLEPDDALSGTIARPPAGTGERAWLLRALVAHVDPSRWPQWLGADPRALVERALRSEEAALILEGWIEATARFADRSWATALLREADVQARVTMPVGRVLAGLGSADRIAVLTETADRIEPVMLAQLSECVPSPWPGPVADAVIDAARQLAREAYPDQAYYALVRAAARGMAPDRADTIVEVASQRDEIRPALTGAVETIRLRARIHDAFAALPPLQPTKENS